MADIRTGSCLCGSVTYTVSGDLREVIACHCQQCRKQSGHFFAATNAPDHALQVTDTNDSLRWYQSSAKARRGFCASCGSTLFWKHEDDDFTSVLAGSVNEPTGLKLTKHIFCADKGDYYELNDGLPQSP